MTETGAGTTARSGNGQARETMHRLWPTDAIPGEALQLLPLPRHFSQVGGEREGFFEFYAGQVLPRLRAG